MNKDQKQFRKLARKAVKLYRKKEWGASIAVWDEIISLLQDDLIKASVYIRRSYANTSMGDHKGAIADCDRALEIRPQYARAYSNRSIAKTRMGDYKGAIADCDRALEIRPQYAGAYNNRGNAKTSMDDYKGAIADYDRAIEIRPQDAVMYSNRGITKTRMGDHKGAIADHDRALGINPQYANAYNNRGCTKDDMGDYEGAIADCDRALEIRPQYADAYNNRGNAKDNMGDHKGAIADYDRAIEINPQYATAYYNRGNAKGNMGNHKGAIADYDRAIKINPNHESAIHNRAVALAMQSSQKGRKEIETKYQAQLRTQQEEFDRKMQEQAKFQQEEFDRKMQEREQALQENLDARFAEAFDSGEKAIKSSDYEKRLRTYSRLFQLHGILVLFGALGLAWVAFRIFSDLTDFGVQMWQCTQSPMAMSCFSPLSLLPFILMGTLVLTTLAWIVRILNRDKHKYWVLREDALANLTLMLIIESNLKSDIKRKLWLQLFDHHDKRGSARLIADWNHSDTSGNNFTINSGGGGIRP